MGKEVNQDMRNKFVSLSVVAMFALALTVVGCGKKEEPAPPPPPPAPAPPESPAPAVDQKAAEPMKDAAPATAPEKKEEAKTK